MSSLFSNDLRQEQLLQPFLDRCYLQHGIQVERCTDTEHQRQGIDVYLSKDGYTYAVDEKAQLHYIGASLHTFVLEIDLLKNGHLITGWLFDAIKATQVYAFVFDIESHNGTTRLETATQVSGAQIILVGRSRLVAALDAVGLNRQMLEGFSIELRRSGEKRRTVRNPGTAVVLSRQLKEQPVNLLVKRSFLRSIGQSMTWTAASPAVTLISSS